MNDVGAEEEGERKVRFLRIPDPPVIDYLSDAVRPGERLTAQLPLLRHEREEARDFILLFGFAMMLGAFIALAAERFWWLA